MKISILRIVFLIFIVCQATSCNTNKKEKITSTETPLVNILEKSLKEDVVDVWYPRTFDSLHGGFYPDFDSKWNKKGPQNKMIVTQARHIWTASTLAMFYKDDSYKKIAAHGYEFLRDNMWDDKNGGFYTLKGVDGDSLKVLSTSKSAYGNSFAIYGLATYYKISKDSTALNLAKKAFYWLDEHARDSIHKGYFDVLKQDGSWLLDTKINDKNYGDFVRKDWKDQNSSIHLLECFTALYEVWPDSLLKERLEEIMLLVRDTITTDKGTLTLHLQRDWTPVSFKDSTETYRKANFWLDHVSFGHDVETAFLLLEASHVLGIENDTITLHKAKKMVDHAIAKGWDNDKGGFFDGGYYLDDSDICTIENPAKVWWTQAEGLNTLLLMSKLFHDEKYYDLFEKQWNYINTYMIDHENGGWHNEGTDSKPEVVNDAKAQVWKVNYHNTRAMVNVIKMLNDDFELTKHTH